MIIVCSISQATVLKDLSFFILTVDSNSMRYLKLSGKHLTTIIIISMPTFALLFSMLATVGWLRNNFCFGQPTKNQIKAMASSDSTFPCLPQLMSPVEHTRMEVGLPKNIWKMMAIHLLPGSHTKMKV